MRSGLVCSLRCPLVFFPDVFIPLVKYFLSFHCFGENNQPYTKLIVSGYSGGFTERRMFSNHSSHNILRAVPDSQGTISISLLWFPTLSEATQDLHSAGSQPNKSIKLTIKFDYIFVKLRTS